LIVGYVKEKRIFLKKGRFRGLFCNTLRQSNFESKRMVLNGIRLFKALSVVNTCVKMMYNNEKRPFLVPFDRVICNLEQWISVVQGFLRPFSS
jgi:hypothetical protein